jgi:hypothetical protein
MGYIVYTPYRSTVGGSTGKLHPAIQQFATKHTDNVVATPSLDESNVETTYLGRAKFHDVLTDPRDLSEWPYWEEFWHSVIGGQNFTLDAYGTEGSPNNPLTVKLVPNTWKEQSPGPRHRLYGFRVRVV